MRKAEHQNFSSNPYNNKLISLLLVFGTGILNYFIIKQFIMSMPAGLIGWEFTYPLLSIIAYVIGSVLVHRYKKPRLKIIVASLTCLTICVLGYFMCIRI